VSKARASGIRSRFFEKKRRKKLLFYRAMGATPPTPQAERKKVFAELFSKSDRFA
jgi:hypothetical protein